jgi:hypothetical protein
MQIKTYDETDLRELTCTDSQNVKFKYQFIADVAGDNIDVFEDISIDNNELGTKMWELGAVGARDCLDTESCCFYIYFKTKKDGIAFLKKLSAYLIQKKKLLEEAKAY